MLLHYEHIMFDMDHYIEVRDERRKRNLPVAKVIEVDEDHIPWVWHPDGWRVDKFLLRSWKVKIPRYFAKLLESKEGRIQEIEEVELPLKTTLSLNDKMIEAELLQQRHRNAIGYRIYSEHGAELLISSIG